ncbi:MAG: ABC transporter permease [Planctomycetota bacterium]|jgi:ABC-2 type transport system permease protein
MSKVLTVAWRDFKQTVMRKIFLIAILGIPVAMVSAIALIVLFMITHKEPPLIGTIALVDPTGEVTPAAEAEFHPEQIARDVQEQIEQIQEASEELMRRGGPSPGLDPRSVTTFQMEIGSLDARIDLESHGQVSDAQRAGLKERVRAGDLLALAVFSEAVLEAPDHGVDDDRWSRFELFAAEALDDDHVNFIERRLGEAVVRVRAARADLDPDAALAMLRRPRSTTSRVLVGGEEAEEHQGVREVRQMIPMIFMMLLWVATFTSGQHLMMSTIEEKSNRVMEVLLSAVSPFQLMAGKILGQGGVGLLIILLYSALGLCGLFVVALTGVVEARALVEFTALAYLFVFFFMAFFMIASIFAAVGSAVTDIREANTLVTPVMFIVMIPLLLWMPISNAPNGGIATAFSFIPPAIPFVMILRVAADEPVPLWQIPATILWGTACVAGMIWMAAKIFRVGVLMYGKPPSPLQLVKWVRYT